MISGRIFQCSVTEVEKNKLIFLENLNCDLQLIGQDTRICRDPTGINYSFIPHDLSNKEPTEIGEIYKSLKLRQIRGKLAFIQEMEASGVLRNFINGQQLNPSSIKPRLKICQTEFDYKLANYCRLLQSVPNSIGVGRRFTTLIYDIGQGDKPVLMGLICLADASNSLKNRDDYLDWSDKAKRTLGLKMVMQLTVCMALPPYNLLFGAKLIAGLVLSNPIQEEFYRRYKMPLLAVLTTSATGIHNAIFNRIKLNRLVNNTTYSGYASEMYKRIGETSSRTLGIISDGTVESAKRLVNELDKRHRSEKNSASGFHTLTSKNRIIYEALRICGLSRRILDLNKKGLYLGTLHAQNIQYLRNPSTALNPITFLDVGEFTEFWKERWVMQALNSEDRVSKLLGFRGDQLALRNCSNMPVQEDIKKNGQS